MPKLARFIPLAVLLIIWCAGTIGIAYFENTQLNHWLIEKLGNYILISDAINFGVAIGTMALAVFGWMAYRYAIDGYKKQAKINEITKARINHQVYIIEKISTILGCVQELFIDAKVNHEMAANAKHEALSELEKAIFGINELNDNINKSLNQFITKLHGLQIETICFYSALQTSKNSNEAVKKSILELANHLRTIIHVNDENKTQLVQQLSLAPATETEAIQDITSFLKKRSEYFERECDNLITLLFNISQSLKEMMEESN